jgi:hypothetical protein
MKARIFLEEGTEKKLLAEVNNMEVCPRGFYVVDGQVYQYIGQPTFFFEKLPYLHGGGHTLVRVEITVQKF